MPSRIACFWLEPTANAEVSLRRYAAEPKCEALRAPYPGHAPVAWGIHDARVKIDTRARGTSDASHHPTPEEMADPRWPKKCVCGYEFVANDYWQYNVHALYMRCDTQALVTLYDAPAGAMWDAPWHKGHHGKFAKPDGLYIVVRTPAGDWLVDGPSSNNNGAGWQRTGTPPQISVTPSIGFPNFHGWLRNGVLEIDTP